MQVAGRANGLRGQNPRHVAPTDDHALGASWACWAFALALLLKAAVPMLASAAADVQGKSLVEVCTVYGVKTVELGTAHGGDEHAPADHATHEADHCALGALILAGALEAPPAQRLAVESCSVVPTAADLRPPARDACAAWVARLKHGPPSFA